MIFIYRTPSLMIAPSVVNMPTARLGKRLTRINRITAVPRAICIAVADIFFMGPVCFFPQYWLQKITRPSPMAVRSCWKINWIWFTAATPERETSL